MARILIAWELGHGLGHVLPLRALTGQLLAQGHEVFVAGRDLLRVRRFFTGSGAHILSAPFFPGLTATAVQQSSLADVIWYDAGGHSPEVLGAVFLAWRELMIQLRVDLLIADAAPVALAAAKGLARTIYYAGFFHATDPSAWKIFRDWERVDVAACEERAHHLLRHLNQARTEAGLSAATTLTQGFGAQSQMIRGMPELDYAAPRTGVHYLSQVSRGGAEPQWPQPHLPRRVFAYLRKGYAHADRVVSALARLTQTSVLCFHDGLPADKMRAAEHMAYSTEAFDMHLLLPQVDVVICHGGGLQSSSLRYGKPMLVLPMQTEQFLCGRMAVNAGAALLYLAKGERPEFLPMIRDLLSNNAFLKNAQRIADSARDRDPEAVWCVSAEAERLLASDLLDL